MRWAELEPLQETIRVLFSFELLSDLVEAEEALHRGEGISGQELRERYLKE